MNKVVTFGEIMLRLSPPGFLRFSQSNSFDVVYGGGESNVAVSLANYGVPVDFVTRLPQNDIGQCAMMEMRKRGVGVDKIVYGGERLGIYFLETGAVSRGSKVVYDRAHSSISEIEPGMIDWEKIFEGVNWFHWTGITPALTQGSFDTLKQGLILAKEKGLTISADPTYRSGLWKYDNDPKEALTELLHYSTIFIGGINEINEVLGTEYNYSNEAFIEASKQLIKEFPSIEKVFDKIRTSVNASWHKIRARMWNGVEFRETEDLDITHVVDRIGTGDAFAAGLIYGLQKLDDDYKAIEFASAACALKHTYEGDVNLATVKEVMGILGGNTSGRLTR